MPMTLAEMKVGMSDKVAQKVVDIFLRESEVLQLLPFDNCTSPSGGSTLTYSYMQKLLPSVASFRALNSEYTANQATLQKKSADLKIFGGAFQMDRVLKAAEGRYNNMAFQMEEKILAAISLFHYTLINGDLAKCTRIEKPEITGCVCRLTVTFTAYPYRIPNADLAYPVDESYYPDLDGDGSVTALDALMIQDAAANIGAGEPSGLTPEQERRADADRDGEITASDAQLVLEFSASAGGGDYTDDPKGWTAFLNDRQGRKPEVL